MESLLKLTNQNRNYIQLSSSMHELKENNLIIYLHKPQYSHSSPVMILIRIPTTVDTVRMPNHCRKKIQRKKFLTPYFLTTLINPYTVT